MREDAVPYRKKKPCPKEPKCPYCMSGRLHSVAGAFEWLCIGGCGTKMPKRCPCYYEKELCRGCTYYKLCAHRPGISKKVNIQPEGEN